MPKLLEAVRDRIRARHYSLRTGETYLRWVRNFILSRRKRHPTEMGAGEARDYLAHLAARRNVSASTQNQALSATRFLYRNVLEIKLDWVDVVVRARKPARLPVVFTKEEARTVLDRLDGTKCLMASFLHARS